MSDNEWVRKGNAGTVRINMETRAADIWANPYLKERDEPTMGRVRAFEELADQLAAATALYRLGPGDSGRYGVQLAMQGLCDFLSRRGIRRASLEPLMGIMAAVVEIEQGARSALFEPDEVKPNRPRKGIEARVFDGLAAVVVECCCLHFKLQGERPFAEPGCREAARLITSVLGEGREMSWREAQELRERVRQAGRGDIARDAYDELMQSPLTRTRPLAWAQLLVKMPQFSEPQISE